MVPADNAKQSDSRPNQRDFSNVLVNPKQQMRYAFVFFGGGIALMCLYIIFFLVFLNSTISSLANTFAISPEVAQDLNRAIITASIALVAFSATLTFILFAAGIALSHRIFGPMVPIQRLVDELQQGNYKARGTLRKKDEWQDLMTGLNNLAMQLEAKHGSSKSEQ